MMQLKYQQASSYSTILASCPGQDARRILILLKKKLSLTCANVSQTKKDFLEQLMRTHSQVKANRRWKMEEKPGESTFGFGLSFKH